MGAEQIELAKEEADLRRALEDAGAPFPTVEDHAREKLAAIRSRLCELRTARGLPEMATDGIGPEGTDLIMEGKNLAAYLEGTVSLVNTSYF